MLIVIIVTAMIVSILAGAFAIQNAVPITVTFFQNQFEASLALVILVTLAVGIAVGLLVSLPAVIQKSLAIVSLKKQLEENQTTDRRPQTEDQEQKNGEEC